MFYVQAGNNYRDDDIPVNKRTIIPKTRLDLTRSKEIFCNFTTLDSLILEDNLPIFGFNINPL